MPSFQMFMYCFILVGLLSCNSSAVNLSTTHTPTYTLSKVQIQALQSP
jgi:Ni,Fe-hydrogenase III small subunit